MSLLAISEKTVGLSLSIHHWKALSEQNMNIIQLFGRLLSDI